MHGPLWEKIFVNQGFKDILFAFYEEDQADAAWFEEHDS